MPSSLTLSDKQHCPAGVSIVDQDGQPIVGKPEGVSVSFASDNEAVATVTPSEDGLNCDIASGLVGTANVSAAVTMPDGSVLSDVIAVAVQNSLPGSVNFTAGTPVAEG